MLFVAITLLVGVPPISKPITQEEAEAACRYYEAGDSWVCHPGALEHMRVKLESSLVAPKSGMNVVVFPLEDLCVKSIGLSVSQASERITIDWNKVSLNINGVSNPALPGFARLATAAVAQRPSVVEPGAALQETVFGTDGAKECLLPPAPPSGGDRLELNVPIIRGKNETLIRWQYRREYVPQAPATVFSLIPEPEVSPPPGDPPKPPTLAPFREASVGLPKPDPIPVDGRFPWELTLGGIGGSLAAIGAGMCCGGFFYPSFAPVQNQQTSAIFIGLCCGGPALAAIGTGVAGAGFPIGYFADSDRRALEEANEEYERQIERAHAAKKVDDDRRTAEYEAAHAKFSAATAEFLRTSKKNAAWKRKRAELGLVETSS